MAATWISLPPGASGAVGGGLKQLTSAKGCIVDETSVPSGCEDVRAMQNVSDVAISPDGNNVYVSSRDQDAIAEFDRNASTGELTQKSSITGCITSDSAVATAQSCNLIASTVALDNVSAITVSPDGKSLYTVTAAGGKLSNFDRAADGTLSYKSTNACCSQAGANAVVVSPDGTSVYTAGPYFGGIVVWSTRITTPGSTFGDTNFAQCWGNGGGCISAQNVGTTPTALAVTPDNKELLIASSDNNAVLGWNRASDGTLTPSATVSRCVSNTTLSATCQARAGISSPQSLALADSGTRIYLGSQYSVTTIDRSASTNDLTPETTGNCTAYPGSSFAGCTPAPGTDCCTAFYPLRDVVTTPDGAGLYAGTMAVNGSIFGFLRNSENLSLNPAPTGCVSVGAVGGCTAFRSGAQVQALAASPDSRQIYAAGANRLYTFNLDRPPVCAGVTADAVFNTATTVTFDCSDPDGDPLSYEIVDGPARGTLASVQGNSVNYGPLLGTIGSDSFTYRALGAGARSDPATATVTVAGPPGSQPPPTVTPPEPTDNSACDAARKKLKKAKQKLKDLKHDDAKPEKIEKAKDKVAHLKKKVKTACA